jgi:hypothetical protein
MAAGYPSGFNTFVPSFDASGHLAIAFSRNPKDFSLNRYITLTPVKKSSGYYLRITAEQAARVINKTTLAEFVWPDSNDAPTGEWGTESFQFVPFNTTRYAFPFRLGYKAVDQADWKILANHSMIAAQDAMTARTVRTVQKLLDTTQYDSSHVATATSLGGGFWSAGTTSNPYIKIAMNKAAQQIQLDTLASVKVRDLQLVVSPVVAAAMAASSEIQDYVKNSPFAMAQVRGDSPSNNGQWGMPDMLYGYGLVVEDAVQVTSRKGATRAASYVFDGNTALMVARPGELTGHAGGPSFSTGHIFTYEEMTVEQRDDPDNRRIAARVVEDYDVQVVAPASGFIITHTLS